jgi:hypothetical protein
MMMSNTFIGVAFWIFVAVVAVASIWYAYERNRETQKTIRRAIEKGMKLDPAVIDKLVARRSGKPEDYYVGGFMCLAVGIGLPILGYCIGQSAIEPEAQAAFGPLLGVGILVGLIGIGLIVCGKWIVGRREKAAKTGKRRM